MNPATPQHWRNTRTEVGLAEALQASAMLGVQGGVHAQWLATALGLVWQEKAAALPAPVAAPDGSPLAGQTPAPQPPRSAPAPAAKKLKLLQPVEEKPLLFEQHFGKLKDEILAAGEIAPSTLRQALERPRHLPLLEERWFQGIFTAALATSADSREIDFRTLERHLSQDRPLETLPFKKHGTLTKGVHVLLDRSESMQPFWRDQSELVARLQRLLGVALVKEAWFEMAPFGPAASRLQWSDMEAPTFHEQMPVLLVTDFGVGQDATAASHMDWAPWQPLFQLAESSHAPITALLPSDKEHCWPAGLAARTVSALLWDRETSPRTALRSCPR
ncbi:hypothetical protein [Prosthecobacter sp.]|uniref:hypothetical protein n=1 Tax=Prosthecobacter sp. TaxID=1965333 RepID=UPI003784667D